MSVTTNADAARWLLLVVRLPVEPSRTRVAVWRELRKVGALSLGQGVWAMPDVAVFAAALARTVELAEAASGEATVLTAAGRSDADAARLAAMFSAAREADWAEFVADCGKYEDEIDKEIAKRKFTLAELDEEEQSLERLRRWQRDLRARDVFGTELCVSAAARLKECEARLEHYTGLVFEALHQV
jgi:hypothetical protein